MIGHRNKTILNKNHKKNGMQKTKIEFRSHLCMKKLSAVSNPTTPIYKMVVISKKIVLVSQNSS